MIPPLMYLLEDSELVAGSAVGQAHQLDDVAEGAPPGRGAAGPDVRVVRVSANDEDS